MATNASWGSIDFDVLWDNPFATPLPPQRHTLTVRKVPYGSRTIVQDLGKEATEVTYRAELATSEYTAALALIGTTATLTVDGDGARGGVLFQGFDQIERDDTNSIVTATLSFLVG